jgi:hypothetical protein
MTKLTKDEDPTIALNGDCREGTHDECSLWLFKPAEASASGER